jgi:hypothetical protein
MHFHDAFLVVESLQESFHFRSNRVIVDVNGCEIIVEDIA